MKSPRVRSYTTARARCRTCLGPKPEPKFGECDRCQEMGRFLAHLHSRCRDREADPTGEKARRVERYAEIIAAGGRIFE